MYTYGVFDAETVQLSLCQSTPDLRTIDLVRVLHTTVEGNHMFHQNVNGSSVLVVLLVNHECFLIQSMLGSDLRDLGSVVVLQLVDVSNDLPLVRADGSKE